MKSGNIFAAGLCAALLPVWMGSVKNQGDFHTWNEAERRTNNLVMEDEFTHLNEQMYDYSGNDMMDNWKHMILNPAHMWIFKIPMIYAQEIGQVILQNIIPATLLFSGILLAFDKSPLNVAGMIGGGLGKLLGPGFGVVGSLLKTVFKEGLKPLYRSIKAQMGRMSFRDNIPAQLSLAAGLTLSAALLWRFINVFTGQARENEMDFIDDE